MEQNKFLRSSKDERVNKMIQKYEISWRNKEETKFGGITSISKELAIYYINKIYKKNPSLILMMSKVER